MFEYPSRIPSSLSPYSIPLFDNLPGIFAGELTTPISCRRGLSMLPRMRIFVNLDGTIHDRNSPVNLTKSPILRRIKASVDACCATEPKTAGRSSSPYGAKKMFHMENIALLPTYSGSASPRASVMSSLLHNGVASLAGSPLRDASPLSGSGKSTGNCP